MFLTPDQVDLLPSEDLRLLLKKLLAEFGALLYRKVTNGFLEASSS